MKKKLLALVFVIGIVLNFISVARAETVFLYGNVVRKTLSDGFSQSLQLKIADAKGVITTYNCNNRVQFDGKSYRYLDELYTKINEGSFIKFAVENDVITIINSSSECVLYENVSYDEKSKLFKGLRKNKTGIPVYYKYNGSFVPAHPDKNHLYDIEVYDYAVLITDIRSKTDAVVLEYIDVSGGIGRSFNQSVNIYCETESSDDFILKGKLYDENKSLIASEEFESRNEFELSFSGLENVNKSYIYEIWLEDAEGNKVSSVYTGIYDVKEAEIVYAYIDAVGMNSGIVQKLQMRTIDAECREETYEFNTIAFVNGTRYRSANEIKNEIQTETFAKMAIENGKISVLNFTDTSEYYEDVSDKEIVEKNVAVYYMPDGEFLPAYVDENHRYGVEVYDYAVVITDMHSKEAVNTIKYIDAGSSVNRNFGQTVSIYCETDSPEDFVIKGELYNESGELIAETENEGYREFEIAFSELENKSESYTVKFWLEDFDANKVSSVYSKNVTVNECEIVYAYIAQKGEASGIYDKIQVKTYDNNGKEQIYDLGNKVYINRVRYGSSDEILNSVETESFAKMAIQNGVVAVMNFDNSPQTYSDASHTDILSENLTVFYRYGRSFVPAYLDENHNYEIEVYDYAVCITDMVSKNMPNTIKYIALSEGIDRNFMQLIDIECETDSRGEFTLKAKIHARKSKNYKASETSGDGYFYLEFDSIENKPEEYTVELWLEDESHNRVSNIYEVKKGVKKTEIIYGDVVLKYTKTENGEEKEVMLIKDINGNERSFVCDENISVVSPVSTFAFGEEEIPESTEIPENTLVKLASEDGVIKVIQLELNSVEVASGSFKEENGVVEGSVCVMNSSGESVNASCIAAIYSADNKLKSVVEIPVEANADADETVYPSFGDYDMQDGDYIKIFTMNRGQINPLFNSLYENITVLP